MENIIKQTENGKLRVIEEVNEVHLLNYACFMVTFKIQVKRKGLLCFGYETIKEWPLTNDNNDDDYDLYLNEAIELFDNIVDPYKVNNHG